MIRSLKRINNFEKSLLFIFVNRFIRHGRKSILYRNFIMVLIKLKMRYRQSFIRILNFIVLLISPLVQLKPKFASGIIYLIPDYPKFNKSLVLGLKFFIKAVKNRQEYEFRYRLLYEIRDILRNKGLTLKYKKEFYKLVLMNRHLFFKFNRKKKY